MGRVVVAMGNAINLLDGDRVVVPIGNAINLLDGQSSGSHG